MGGSAPVPIGEIARRRDIPVQFLEGMFATLRRAGLLQSQRGVKGGYSFARPPAKITVLDIVEALEGALDTEAVGDDPVWSEAVEALREKLRGTTVAQVADKEPPVPRVEHRDLSGVWVLRREIKPRDPLDIGKLNVVAFSDIAFDDALNVAFYFVGGWGLWLWAVLGAVIVDAQIPALAVYGPELFPTSLRGRANGIITITSLAGSAVGLAAAGALADHFGRIGPALALLGIGPLVLALLVVVAYPETAGLELEEINPEDAHPPLP